MRGSKKSFKNIIFTLMVFVSVCVLLGYAAEGRIFSWKNYENSQGSNNSKSDSGQLQENLRNYSNEEVLKGKPLPVSTLINEVKPKLPAINNVSLAEIKNGEQTVVLVDNPQQQNTDVVLVAKGVRTKWIFRFKDSIPCNGKISIERFGLIIPVVEKDMDMTFAPFKDFTVTCDKGKFNYYIKVVDKLNIALETSPKESRNTQNANTSSNVKSSTKSSTTSSAAVEKSTTNLNKQVKPEASESKSVYETAKPVETPEPSPAPGSSSNNQEPTSNNGDSNTTQEEPKKKGIFDHLFHHH